MTTRPDLAELVAGLLDPVVCAGPFRPADGRPARAVAELDDDWPEPETPVRLAWSAPADGVRRDLPGLWAVLAASGGVPLSPRPDLLLDLVVDLDALGRLVAADVAQVPVAELLAGLGDAEGAAAARGLVGLAAEVGVPGLADLWERLVWSGGGRGSSRHHVS